jgi:hypothetical protein
VRKMQLLESALPAGPLVTICRDSFLGQRFSWCLWVGCGWGQGRAGGGDGSNDSGNAREAAMRTPDVAWGPGPGKGSPAPTCPAAPCPAGRQTWP